LRCACVTTSSEKITLGTVRLLEVNRILLFWQSHVATNKRASPRSLSRREDGAGGAYDMVSSVNGMWLGAATNKRASPRSLSRREDGAGGTKDGVCFGQG